MADKRAGNRADDGWIARVATAAGVAAGAGAAQLGLGYGLGVVVWPSATTPDDSVWLGSLGWAVWITASATVFGALVGSRVRGGPGPRTTGAWRFALAACAALGALVTVALIALPARSAVRPDTFTPQVIAGGYAAIGLLLGLIVAFWAVSSTPVAANLIATTVWLWALPIAAVIVELATNRTSATYLTSWQFAEVASSGRYGAIYWPSALLTMTAAFLIGAIAAAPAARRGDLSAAAATSGAAGPLLVAFAFLALAPRLTGALGPIESAYLIAPYAVLTGLAGSALTVAAARSTATRRATRAATAPLTPSSEPTSPRTEPTSPSPEPTSPRTEPSSPRTKPTSPSAVPLAPSPAALSPTPGALTAPAETPKKPKTRLFGRSKVPTQPTTSPTDAPQSSDRPTTTGQPQTSTTAPSPTAAPRPAPTSNPRPAPTSATAPASRPTPSAAPTSSKTPAQAGDRSAAKVPEPTADTEKTAELKPVGKAPVVDPEIAAAARPTRPRPAKKAAPKSTVAPPPSTPTIAQINPKPPTDA
ncbi:Hansenula MRAKII killer toxin-resistant protein 1 [Actinoplanes sp. CA-054009]